ncbi:MAG: glycerate kinase family protein [Erysipelotrichaceae bacterium]
MKILIASDSFKNCLSSWEAASAMERGILRADPKIEIIKYAVGDGGEGTLDAFKFNAKTRTHRFHGRSASGKTMEMSFEYIDEQATAFIEVAQIIGLKKQSEGNRAPMYYSSYGVGQAMLQAKTLGAKKIIIGLGGSSTNDGGLGILAALGALFYDQKGQPIQIKAKELIHIAKMDFSNMVDFSGTELIAACDVKNVLLGEKGATHTFGKQKGLFPNQMKALEKGMQHFAQLVATQEQIDLNSYIGGGAAGGIGACLQGFFGAKMQSGLALVLSYTDFESQCQSADLVITGEGQSDHQTMYGKVPAGIIQIAKQYEVPTIIVSGALGYEYMKLYELGFAGIFSISDRVMSFEQALKTAPQKIENLCYSLTVLMKQCKK